MQKQFRFITVILIWLAGLSIDQLTKFLAKSHLEEAGTKSFLSDSLRFQYVENHGGFLGYLNIIPEPFRFYLLTIGVGLLLLFFIYLLVTTTSLSSSNIFLTACIISGGSGNLLDRLIHDGGVIDFMSIGIGQMRTGIFNFADVLILICSFILGYSLIHKAH